jgi:hypothetical protein
VSRKEEQSVPHIQAAAGMLHALCCDVGSGLTLPMMKSLFMRSGWP